MRTKAILIVEVNCDISFDDLIGIVYLALLLTVVRLIVVVVLL